MDKENHEDDFAFQVETFHTAANPTYLSLTIHENKNHTIHGN